MSLLQRLFAPFVRSGPDPRETMRPVYDTVVAEARRTEWYAGGGVADTVPGRFDMVSAVLAAVLLRMERGDDLAQSSAYLTELFIHDMDGQLRELGIGDIVVGKHVGKLMGAMGGRLDAYRAGLEGSDAELTEAVQRNVHFGERGNAAQIATGLRTLSNRLARTGDEALLRGEIAA